MRAIGSSLPRIDAAAKVTGAALYSGDVNLPNQTWMKLVFAGIPHARVNAVDVEAARAAPGVITVLTAADVPANEYGLNAMPDQPVLVGTGSSEQAGTILWEADRIAVVVAETQAQAEAAAKLVKLDCTPLPVLTDPFDAMQPDAPILHPHPFHYPYGERDLTSNVLLEYKIRHGDMQAGWAQADVVVESTYRTQAQEHAYLQPEAGVAWVRPDGRLEVICGGQWMHEEREQIAHALGLPHDQVVVRYPAIGGAFGGREDISIQITLALAAWKTGRPIKAVWSREESIVGHHKRHPFTIKARWGATRDGKIVAAEVDATSDCGPYASTSTKVLGNALLSVLGPYNIPNAHVTARTVYTNNTPSGAFRGFGGPQGHFAAEMQVNKLADLLGMDPVELRMRNLWREGDFLPTAAPLPAGVTAVETLAAAAEIVEVALACRDRGIVGVDLAGDEMLHPALPFAPLFRHAAEQGLGITVHAGEAGGSENVREAIEQLNARRIGHGIHAIEDSAVIQLIRQRNVTLEVCPTSNLQTGVMPNFGHHPLRDLYQLRVPVTVNTDDPSVSDTTLTDEYLVTVKGMGLGLRDLRTFNRNAIRASFLPVEDRLQLEQQILEEFDQRL